MADLIVALDYTDALDAFNMGTALRHEVQWVKVGLELFIHEGSRVVQTLKGMGYKVMLDLKMFDIPNTVRGGIHSACGIGADIITIHLLGGERMVKAAVEECATYAAREGTCPLLFGVTVLTSADPGDLPFGNQTPEDLTLDLAAKAQKWGLDGVVCSGFDVATIKKQNPGLLALTPGIRPAGAQADDQRRIMTPEEAVAAGSDFLVIGRPITRALNPVAMARNLCREIKKA